MDENNSSPVSESQQQAPEAITQQQEVKADPKDILAPKFAALSRKEKELRLKEQEIEQKFQKYQEWESSQNQKPVEEPIEFQLKKDPIGTLAKLGLTYDKLTELALNDGKLTTDMRLELVKEELENKYKSELEKFKEEFYNDKKQQEEEKYEQVYDGFLSEIRSEMSKNIDKYELANAHEAHDLVAQVIEMHYEETKDETGEGEIMEVSEALDLVEKYLEEQAEKVAKLNKIQAKFKSQMANPKSQTTLSNSMSSESGSVSEGEFLSDEESKRRAAALLRWND